MKANHLRNALPAICEAVTGQKGVKIVWKGPPRTDGKTIYSNPLPAQADEETVKMVVGDVDHECVHILYTDFELLASEHPEPLAQGVWNGLEDTMGERRLGEDFLGCKETLRESAEIAVKRGQVRTGENGPSDALITFVDAWGRVHVNNQQGVRPILGSSQAALTEYLGESGVSRLEALLATKLYSVATTAGTQALTGQVLQLIKDIEEEQQEEPQNPDDQGDEGDEDGDGDSQSGGPPEGDGTDSGEQGALGDPDATDDGARDQGGHGAEQADGESGDDGPGDQQGGQTDRANADDGAANGAGASAILQDEEVDTSAVVDLKAMAEEAVEEMEANGAFIPGASGYSKPPAAADRPRYDALQGQISSEIAQLQRRLAALFETRQRCRSVVAEEGRLDGRRLHLALAGSRAVYRRKEVKVVPKPVVSFAIDCSDSMAWGTDKMALALQAVIAVAEVCDRMAVPTEVVVFGGFVGAVKTFDQPLARTRDVIGAIKANGGTPAAEGLWEAGTRLIRRRENRKILFAVTDGVPNDPAATKEVGDMIEASGIELYGIGIGSDAIAQYCSKSKVLVGADGIASAVLNALQERML